MQRDFLEEGGFGDALGNDVTRLQAIVPTVKQLLEAFRAHKLPIFQTIECHKPDLSDCPPSKLHRGKGRVENRRYGSHGTDFSDG
jgi:nicotinamidase-related amidase